MEYQQMKKNKNYNTAECIDLYNLIINHAGHWKQTSIRLDVDNVMYELKKYKDDWSVFNPMSGIDTRYGLSLTSYEGSYGQQNQPDLTSLDQHEKETGVAYHDVDFDVPTELYHNMHSLKPLIDCFNGFFCRFHFLKFDRGARFAFHRDVFDEPYAFRMMAGIHNTVYPSYCFLMDEQVMSVDPGIVTFFNAAVPHAAFAMSDNTIILVINVKLTNNTVYKLMDIC